MERTIKVPLNPTHEQARELKATLDQRTACFNAVAQEGFTTGCSNGVELHKRTYYPLRTQYPDLPAQLVCAARVKATEAVKSALTWKVKQKQAYAKKVEKAKKQGKPIPAFKTVSSKRRLHSWSFAQLYSCIEYKAEAQGIHVVKIDPRHTSQTCSQCGYQHRSNRRSQSLFLCHSCGYTLNADLNASYNIREKYVTSLADFGTSLVGGLSVKQPSVSTLPSEMQAPGFS